MEKMGQERKNGSDRERKWEKSEEGGRRGRGNMKFGEREYCIFFFK
jgi:hypothetical protein